MTHLTGELHIDSGDEISVEILKKLLRDDITPELSKKIDELEENYESYLHLSQSPRKHKILSLKKSRWRNTDPSRILINYKLFTYSILPKNSFMFYILQLLVGAMIFYQYSDRSYTKPAFLFLFLSIIMIVLSIGNLSGYSARKEEEALAQYVKREMNNFVNTTNK